ncbi:hypothetical protein Plhal304r1_c006g0024151 [Plasmopara halstedii]
MNSSRGAHILYPYLVSSMPLCTVYCFHFLSKCTSSCMYHRLLPSRDTMKLTYNPVGCRAPTGTGISLRGVRRMHLRGA